MLKEKIAEFILKEAEDARIDYIEIVNYEKMEKIEHIAGEILIAEAVFIDGVRLIDNKIMKI